MTNRERENATLGFEKPDRGAVEETFYPWPVTVERFAAEGLPPEIAAKILDRHDIDPETPEEKYFRNSQWQDIMDYENYLGFDAVRRISFPLPFMQFLDKKISSMEEWEILKEKAKQDMDQYFTDEIIHRQYSALREGHVRGDYSIRLFITGFFWVSRDLLGIEEQLYAFYDMPELIHAINEYVLEIYMDKLRKAVKILEPDVIYISEDLSGKTGPMISRDTFHEFVGNYYRRLIPMLKENGAGHIFVDTDGDFNMLIPDFMDTGVEGFLPMDVNAGMDIVKVREQFPRLKFIGGYNKLMIAEGKEAIDREFERILPVIRSGGFIPGADHQVAPSTSLENYKYYIHKLREVMTQAGTMTQTADHL